MPKSILYAIVALILTAIVIISVAYGLLGGLKPSPTSSPTPTTVTQTPVEKREYYFKMPTGSPTGTFYIAAQAIAAIVSKYTPEIVVVAIPGGGSVSNSRAVGRGDVPISLSTSLVAYYAYKGLPPFFTNESYPNLRAVAPIHPLVVGFLVKSGSGIKTVYDLAGKRVAIGEPGSGDAVVSEIILKEAGIWDKAVKLNIGDPESWDMLLAGQVDAVIHHTIVPNPSIYELSMRLPLSFVEIPEEIANRLIEKYKFFGVYVAKAGSYNGMDRDVRVLKVPSIIIANSGAPEELIYKFVKAYWEHFDEVVVMAEFLRDVDRNNPFGGIAIPLHQGAFKYFVEKGFVVPDEIKPK
ncbi:MAG: TAXI family TRAP transporter solute-binding subunit [Sulfolobales archaeon]